MDEFKITEKTIDIEGVIKSKNPGVAKVIPRFVLNYLKRLIHEDFINDFLYQNRDLMGLDFVDAIIEWFGAIVKVDGEEKIPEEGRVILAANHPLGGLDGVALMQVVGRVRKDIIFPVNDLLMYLPNLQELFIPINKHGSNAENIKIIHDTFESNKLMLYFPAGLVSRKQHGKIEDLEWKKTFIAKAKQYKRDVIPVFVKGKNTKRFYRIANLRKTLKIEANIEMLFLPDEMHKQRNKTIEIIVGNAIPFETFDKRYNYNQWAQKVKNYVYAMGKGYKEPFDPEKF
jgi:putative hemolysin